MKSVDDLQGDLNLPASQLLAMFNKAIHKLTAIVRASYEQDVARQIAEEEHEGKKLVKGLQGAAQ